MKLKDIQNAYRNAVDLPPASCLNLLAPVILITGLGPPAWLFPVTIRCGSLNSYQVILGFDLAAVLITGIPLLDFGFSTFYRL